MASSYAVLIVGIAVTMFSASDSLTGMSAVAAVWFGALYALTCWWLRKDLESHVAD
ncbi:hypothetical protein HQ332_21905 [Rhodococcus sp. BP-359]|uniref:hypothetical protein n=1 Tax=unclassified Rhodococcus (in: high G+C Gram-positive bacteria) TaxID=192944 RepID=UPI001C9BB318|nr:MULTISPECIES: hypothetical protein [unclassified Rhodococcus (in: high G+C Gram-positive bacteria)]MBY6597165.1 hypothetical protein [Rhodococcus sp. BP-359]MBY6623191.1 hypothetical protein [Rhodococcus sp. BP-357]MBY6691336.1 hypothetical protein [Rhodococcus sp. BP-331]MBY6640541.1 hypothetical protein [Rhodococcus sp. BP-344]MBY6643855.1 hypothetical protein [Rhodococcus sp. BP-340]